MRRDPHPQASLSLSPGCSAPCSWQPALLSLSLTTNAPSSLPSAGGRLPLLKPTLLPKAHHLEYTHLRLKARSMTLRCLCQRS